MLELFEDGKIVAGLFKSKESLSVREKAYMCENLRKRNDNCDVISYTNLYIVSD